jgi:hypothetical protein
MTVRAADVIEARMRSYGRMRYPITLTPAPATGSQPIKIRDRVKSAVPNRDSGRSDLPVIAPGESPRRVARRLV